MLVDVVGSVESESFDTVASVAPRPVGVVIIPAETLMDIRMPGMDGIAATREILAEGLPSRVLVLTTFDEEKIVHDALKAGASGFLLKTAPPAKLG